MGARKLARIAGVRIVNWIVSWRPPPPKGPVHPALADVVARAEGRTDINDHLVTIFVEALLARPKLIVELGVRGGESTFVFERIAALLDAQLVSVDLEDCSPACAHENATFVQADDVQFATRFAEWCKERGVRPSIDVLFIDTSHEYEHTRREIEAWFPHLSPGATVFFHDTHLVKVYKRKDGSRGLAWDNQRGVIRAIEQHFRTTYDETVPFEDYRDEWVIRHVPWCCGLTVLRRVPPVELIRRDPAHGTIEKPDPAVLA